MFKNFYPREKYQSTYNIDFEKYYKEGYRGLIFDVDNTLVPHNAKADQRVIELIKKLKNIGFKICLLSNNNESRVSSFNKQLDIEFIYMAYKPSRKGYFKAINIMKTDLDNTLFVGDQIFTDIWGANRAGVYSILVGPLNPKEEIQIILKRLPEKLVLWNYKRKLNKK